MTIEAARATVAFHERSTMSIQPLLKRLASRAHSRRSRTWALLLLGMNGWLQLAGGHANLFRTYRPTIGHGAQLREADPDDTCQAVSDMLDVALRGHTAGCKQTRSCDTV